MILSSFKASSVCNCSASAISFRPCLPHLYVNLSLTFSSVDCRRHLHMITDVRASANVDDVSLGHALGT